MNVEVRKEKEGSFVYIHANSTEITFKSTKFAFGHPPKIDDPIKGIKIAVRYILKVTKCPECVDTFRIFTMIPAFEHFDVVELKVPEDDIPRMMSSIKDAVNREVPSRCGEYI